MKKIQLSELVNKIKKTNEEKSTFNIDVNGDNLNFALVFNDDEMVVLRMKLDYDVNSEFPYKLILSKHNIIYTATSKTPNKHFNFNELDNYEIIIDNELKSVIQEQILERIEICGINMAHTKYKEEFYLEQMYNLLNSRKFLEKYYEYQESMHEINKVS